MIHTALLATALGLAALERFPALRFRRARLFRACFTSDVWYGLTGFVAGTALTTALIVAASDALGALGVPRLAALDLPLWATAAVALVTLDLGNYAAHWLMHRVDALWEIHKVHHSSPTLDWLATFRSHLLEQALRRVLAPLGLVLLGVPLDGTLVAAAAFNGWAMLIHSNLRLDLRVMEPVLVTPRLHRIHHDPATSLRNFGTLFTAWDRLLRGRFVHRDVAPDVAFGVPGEPAYPQGWLRQLVLPLRRIAGSTGRATESISMVRKERSMSSIKLVLAAAALGAAMLAGRAEAARLLGFERNVVVVAPYAYGAPRGYPAYAPYLPYEPGAYFRPRPYGLAGVPAYQPGANWRDDWYDATRTKVHGYTLR
jgi:sterol desaturase/sphingolipid hydroxylase (fatty acid hydroxylase superfamily)